MAVDKRTVALGGLAAGLAFVSACMAKALVWLIAVVTNLAYFGRLSSQPADPSKNHLGPAANPLGVR